ncbi:MAG: heat-inducible transcriptional repressor HrcA [Acidimicrobiales bacterium]|nr:heat-inducible transcriptional repressor HrcA [Acidimicrobiales bacterium]
MEERLFDVYPSGVVVEEPGAVVVVSSGVPMTMVVAGPTETTVVVVRPVVDVFGRVVVVRRLVVEVVALVSAVAIVVEAARNVVVGRAEVEGKVSSSVNGLGGFPPLVAIATTTTSTTAAAPIPSHRRCSARRSTRRRYKSPRLALGIIECQMLDERKAAVLRAVVEEYIDTAQPVGSAHVRASAGVAVSSATIRNDMAALERDGYLSHPHTSAGRVPTDKGYRFFVDALTAPSDLGRPEQQKISDFFDHTHGALEQMLSETSQLLATLTNYAAVVVSPTNDDAVVRSVHLVEMGPLEGMAVFVLSNHVVDKLSFELPDATTAETLASASAALEASLRGGVLDLNQRITAGNPAVDEVIAALRASVSRRAKATAAGADQVFVGGTARVAEAFDAVDTVRRVLGVLEHQYVVVSLLRDVLSTGQSVAIGTEHGLAPLAECAVVVAPITVGGQNAGTVGVLGPTRMNYPHALAAVTAVSRRLGENLGES